MIRTSFINRSTIMLVVAVMAGLFASWAAKKHIQGRISILESQARVPEVERVVAAFDLPVGTFLNSSHLAIRRFPAQLVSSDSLPPSRFSELEGTVLRSALTAGDTVLPVHVQQQYSGAFSTTLISGRRAITMPVDAINSVSGLLQPGDLIDLYVSFEYQRRRITAPLLQGVLVLATGTATQASLAHTQTDRSPVEQGYGTVTLDVAPEDAVKLVAARQSGTITAILRNPDDAMPSNKASRGDLASLLGVNVSGPPPRVRKIPVLYGNTAVRTVPRLQPPGVSTRQKAGVFDLPYMPELTSAWIQAAAHAMSTKNDDNTGTDFGLADHENELEGQE